MVKKHSKKSVKKPVRDDSLSNPSVLLFFKGVLMGLFDLVPGISGGTMALITGIYESLINEISNAFTFLKNLLVFNKNKIISSWRKLNKLFLLILILGIVSGLVISVFVLGFFLDKFFVQTMGVISGVIFVASILMIKKYVKSSSDILFGLIGLFLGVLISILTPISGQGFNLVEIFFLGSITIIAMILPGISGALILLLLGGYEFMVLSLRNFNLDVVFMFILGAIFGLALFSRLVNYLLKKHHVSTLAFLSCLMLGAITKPVLEIIRFDNAFVAIPFFVVVVLLSFLFLKK